MQILKRRHTSGIYSVVVILIGAVLAYGTFGTTLWVQGSPEGQKPVDNTPLNGSKPADPQLRLHPEGNGKKRVRRSIVDTIVKTLWNIFWGKKPTDKEIDEKIRNKTEELKRWAEEGDLAESWRVDVPEPVQYYDELRYV
ncbi:unnamed protein product [Cylicostephanus goldi]|uniref:Uncharacterized protein n=1 Tax=Cylicostephanus goldi TaxID=71465 RepID=A0A3P7N615_CYLGO|nr:unnamed protein product [Cylicostephanus goldi]